MFKFFALLLLFVVGALCESNYYDDQPINDQKPAVQPAEQPTEQQLSSHQLPCPKGWRYLAEYSKCLYATPSLTWHEAEQYCVNLSSHLMTIHAQNEVQLGQDMIGTDFWVGLYKSVNAKENTWRYTNNETIGYIPWGYTGTSECAFGVGRQVHQHHPCDLKHSGICQIYAFS